MAEGGGQHDQGRPAIEATAAADSDAEEGDSEQRPGHGEPLAVEDVQCLEADDEGRAEAETAATELINDYMSRYRPRPQVNGLSSFTTMQTALNSLAGHYKTYANRPLPDALRSRVTKELGKAEKAVVRGS